MRGQRDFHGAESDYLSRGGSLPGEEHAAPLEHRQGDAAQRLRNGRTLRMCQTNPFQTRKSGILLHPTSLPSTTGFGDLGPKAFEFVEQLKASGQTWWQTLPVCPTDETGCPYVSPSTFAGNPLLISLDQLAEEGLLSRKNFLRYLRAPRAGKLQPAEATKAREPLLRQAFRAFSLDGGADDAAYQNFCAAQADWLADYARFSALKRALGGSPWWTWPENTKHQDPDDPAFRENVRYAHFEQFVFHRQWHALKDFAAQNRVGLIGDVPIYVAHDSADVWARTNLFELDESRQPSAFAGAPPDYFNREGQHWGNPLYDWATHREEDFAWWKMRLSLNVSRFDALRLDHFIGFARFWAIPAAESPVQGAWREGPGEAFFSALEAKFGALPLIAEDLGTMDEGVHALRNRFALPSMRVLQFAFDGSPDNPHLPHNIPQNAVVYTGTHDNDTVQGWFHGADPILHNESPAGFVISRATALRTFGGEPEDIHWSMIRAALKSRAAIAITPAQDVLGLGNEARMNRPGIMEGNWSWQMDEDAWNEAIQERLLDMTRHSGRLPA